MRHVSRTHRVAFDWLVDRINLDPQIHVKYVDARSQLADILTKGTFTRDEWHQLLQLFDIMNTSLCEVTSVRRRCDTVRGDSVHVKEVQQKKNNVSRRTSKS